MVVRADLDHEAAVHTFLADARISFTDAVVAQSPDSVSFDDQIRRRAKSK